MLDTNLPLPVPPRPTAVLDSAHIGDIRGALGTIKLGDDKPRLTLGAKLKTLAAIVGPGLIVMVGDNDAGAFGTYTQAGQNYGTSLLWTLLLLVPVLYVNQEMVLRLFAVADGVGGQTGGERASRAVVHSLASVPGGLDAGALLEAVRARLEAAHASLIGAAGEAGTGAASTVVALLLRGDHLACLWAGDSRAYLVRGGRLHPLTTDHSLVAEMVRAGTLTEAEADTHPRGNVITRAIGVPTSEELLDKSMARRERSDRLLVCTDGVFKAVPADAILACIGSAEPADTLIAEAIRRGARDNVTALVVA